MVEIEGNATLLARTPVQDDLLANYPSALLTTCGEAVGLPDGQMGNSEVGHLNLGAGRIVYQDLTRISLAIRDKSFFTNPVLEKLFATVKSGSNRLHLIGLCSDGGVHSHLEHLFALLQFARSREIPNVFIHCFTDGRDTSPCKGAEYLEVIQKALSDIGVGKISSIVGRYFAMDRDNRWERTALAFNALVRGSGTMRADPVAATHEWYADGKTDEFIPPTIIADSDQAAQDQTLRDEDGVIFFNFRSDRARQLTRALKAPVFDSFDRGTVPLVDFVCLTEYDETFNLPVAFPSQRLHNTLGQVLAANGLRQLRAAETEKYPHVTFFFNGGAEVPVEGEDRCLVPSPQVSTYDLQPEMSAPALAGEVIQRIRSGLYDVVILNFANPDMVGHTGNLAAAIQAVEVTDHLVGEVLAALMAAGGAALVTADHGNAERMLDEEGNPHTAHTTNPVHMFFVGADAHQWKLNSGILADVAPTMLSLIGISPPAEMSGKNLLVPK